jgi:hypothetical protein
LKINRIAVVMVILFLGCMTPVFNGPAQAYDPRAEVPGATITGIILDANGNNIPNATVRLFLDGQLFDVPRNPQQSNAIAGSSVSVGRYQFMRLPYGQYLIVAEVPDASGNVHRSNLTVNVNAITMTADLVLADLVVAGPGTPGLSAPATPVSSPTHTPVCSIGLLLPVLGICVLMIGKKKIK